MTQRQFTEIIPILGFITKIPFQSKSSCNFVNIFLSIRCNLHYNKTPPPFAVPFQLTQNFLRTTIQNTRQPFSIFPLKTVHKKVIQIRELRYLFYKIYPVCTVSTRKLKKKEQPQNIVPKNKEVTKKSKIARSTNIPIPVDSKSTEDSSRNFRQLNTMAFAPPIISPAMTV